MRFMVIEIQDGGAEAVLEEVEGDAVIKYLTHSSRTWKEALHCFTTKAWKAGDWMVYPCGWIFCVS